MAEVAWTLDFLLDGEHGFTPRQLRDAATKINRTRVDRGDPPIYLRVMNLEELRVTLVAPSFSSAARAAAQVLRAAGVETPVAEVAIRRDPVLAESAGAAANG